MPLDPELKRAFEKLHREIKAISVAQKKETWASPGFVTDLTGWDNEKLRQARAQGLVECKRSAGGGWLYKLESISDKFIIKKQAS